MNLLLVAILSILPNVPDGRSDPMDAAESSGTFTVPDAAEIREQLRSWLMTAEPDAAVRKNALSAWTDQAVASGLSGEELLDRLVESFAAVDAAARDTLAAARSGGPLPQIVFDGIRQEPLYRNHLKLFRARWLTQHRFYDEALEIFEDLLPETVVDPAGLFFYRAVCQRHLLQRPEAMDSLNLLLNHTQDVPVRFRMVADLLLKELNQERDDDLGHVSRLMTDVQRRLELGRSGPRVRQQQKNIIAAIDRLLEQAEQQGQPQEGGSGQPSSGPPSSGRRPADRAGFGPKGRGEADRKELKETGRWGMLDRREEARVRELIRQRFPAGYLDIISEYSRRIAEQN